MMMLIYLFNNAMKTFCVKKTLKKKKKKQKQGSFPESTDLSDPRKNVFLFV